MARENSNREMSYQILMGTDIDGVLRGKLIPRSKIKKGEKNDFGFCGVIFAWDCNDTVYTSTELNRGISDTTHSGKTPFGNDRKGYPDVIARIDTTCNRNFFVPQQPEGISVSFVDFLDKYQMPLDFCPRSVLKNAIGKLQNMGYGAHCGIELEWYNYCDDVERLTSSDAHPHKAAISTGMFGYSMLRPWQNASYMKDILNYCTKSGLEFEAFHTETGPGVYEMALKHKPALEAADNGQLFKYLVKTIAKHHGLTASFMAKPWNDLPGCGGHIHISLTNKNESGNNAFADDDAMMKHFIAGILYCVPDMMPFFAPNINSYKRLDLRYWAPVLIGWGEDDRLAVVRVIKSADDPESTRIEVRIGGADLNPYIAIAAILQAGMYGMEKSLPLPPALETEKLHPSGDVLGEVKKRGYRALPSTLMEGIAMMAAPDSMARRIFPKNFIEHFAMTRLHEIKMFETTVTNWERQRYLELA